MTPRTEYDGVDLLPPARAARLLGISVRTLDRYVEAGRISPACRTPTGHRRFARHEVEALADARVATGDAA